VFTEASKAPIQGKTGIFGTATVNRIAVGLYKNSKNIDGAVVVFGNGFSKTVGKEDAIKFPNAKENLAIKQGVTDLCINGTAMPMISDAFPLHLYNLQPNTSYTIRIDVSQYAGNGMLAYLKDNSLNKQVLLVGDSTVLNFTTSKSDAASYGSRYSIVFGNSPLPISEISLTGTVLRDNSTNIKWSVSGENATINYTVQHSINGTLYTDLAIFGAAYSSEYTYTDKNAIQGANYYRIKMIDNLGKISYSNVVQLSIYASNYASMAIFPNPMVGNKFNLSLVNIINGKYTISLYNKLGKLVYNSVLNHTSSNLTG
jgi:hypothetical protein